MMPTKKFCILLHNPLRLYILKGYNNQTLQDSFAFPGKAFQEMLLTYCFESQETSGTKKKNEIRRRQIVMPMWWTLDLPTISEKDESVKALSNKPTAPQMQNKAKENNNRPVSFEMCIATSICLQLGHISRSYYMCESIRTNAQESQPLLFRKKVLIQYIHCMEKNVLQTSCFVFCKKERK